MAAGLNTAFAGMAVIAGQINLAPCVWGLFYASWDEVETLLDIFCEEPGR